MAPIPGKTVFLLIRLAVALALVSCLAPEGESISSKPATPALTDGPLSILIEKSRYTLTLFRGNKPLKTYRAVFGKGYRDGDKQMQGDRRTPEGDFYICSINRSKRFYKFLGLSYPGLKHADLGLRSGLITVDEYRSIRQAIEDRRQPPWDSRLGGAVGIHGRTIEGNLPSFIDRNWTDGCIALSNTDIDEIAGSVSLGTAVTILP